MHCTVGFYTKHRSCNLEVLNWSRCRQKINARIRTGLECRLRVILNMHRVQLAIIIFKSSTSSYIMWPGLVRWICSRCNKYVTVVYVSARLLMKLFDKIPTKNYFFCKQCNHWGRITSHSFKIVWRQSHWDYFTEKQKRIEIIRKLISNL